MELLLIIADMKVKEIFRVMRKMLPEDATSSSIY